MTGRDRLISILWAPQHTVNDSLTLDCTDTWQPTAESDPRVRLSFHWQTNGCSLVARDGASMISRGAEGHIKENNPVCDLLVSSSSTWEQRWVTTEVRREEGLSITPQPHEKLHMEEDMQRTTQRATRGSDHNIIFNKLDLLPSKWGIASWYSQSAVIFEAMMGITSRDLSWGTLKIYFIGPVLWIATQQLCNHYTAIYQLLAKQVPRHLEKSGTRIHFSKYADTLTGKYILLSLNLVTIK